MSPKTAMLPLVLLCTPCLLVAPPLAPHGTRAAVSMSAVTRRSALLGAGAVAVSCLPTPAFAKGEEVKAAVAARVAKETSERLPINRLKASRERLAGLAELLQSSNPDWGEVRQVLLSVPAAKVAGTGFQAPPEGVGLALRTAGKAVKTKTDVSDLKAKLQKQIFELDKLG